MTRYYNLMDVSVPVSRRSFNERFLSSLSVLQAEQSNLSGMGLPVGFIAFSMFLAIFRLNEVPF